MKIPKVKVRKQVAALPVRLDVNGRTRVLLITSRETHRLIIPKGWPMKGRKDHRAAAIEAQEEAGVIGRVHKKPVGFYTYWKRREDHFDLCRVKVFILEVRSQLPAWREKGQRQSAWLLIDDAADLVDDTGLIPILRRLPEVWPRRPGSKTAGVAASRQP
jgi:8-oxo-dGTP pyrophosphatase MutT (NUDIX family)